MHVQQTRKRRKLQSTGKVLAGDIFTYLEVLTCDSWFSQLHKGANSHALLPPPICPECSAFFYLSQHPVRLLNEIEPHEPKRRRKLYFNTTLSSTQDNIPQDITTCLSLISQKFSLRSLQTCWSFKEKENNFSFGKQRRYQREGKTMHVGEKAVNADDRSIKTREVQGKKKKEKEKTTADFYH